MSAIIGDRPAGVGDDGLLLHRALPVRTDHGAWVWECCCGCSGPSVGSFGSRETAAGFAREHERSNPPLYFAEWDEYRAGE